MRKFTLSLFLMILLVVLSVSVIAAQPEVVVVGSLQDAVDTAQSGSVLTLTCDINESVTIDKNLTLDLNSYSIDGTVSAEDGITVQIKDSKTDDYNVSDDDYGTVTATAGNVRAAIGYLAITEEATSYHKIELATTGATLRASEAGMYYNCNFAGDEVVKRNISGYGVALNINNVPTAEDIAQDTNYKKHAEYSADSWITGTVNDANGVLLKGILKEENGYLFNKRNTETAVYGVAYIRIGDNYTLGENANLTMKQAVEYADTTWKDLEEAQTNKLLEMYETFEVLLKTWKVDNLSAAAQELYEKRTLKILCIGNSFSLDSMWILEHIAEAEGMTDLTLGILYHSGCSLAMHESYLLENQMEYNYYKNVGNGWTNSGGNGTATMLRGIQDEDWDIIVMQQASSASGRPTTYNDDIQVIMDYVLENDKNPKTTPQFAWNMTWAYPVEDDGIGEVTINTTTSFQNYYNNDQMTMYNAIADAVLSKITPNPKFEYIMPVGTAIQNARSSYLGDPDLNRDYSHLSDLGRTIAAYTWYCILTNTTLDDVSIDFVPGTLRYASADKRTDLVLTDELKAIIIESVNNALSTSYSMTQSNYTVKP